MDTAGHASIGQAAVNGLGSVLLAFAAGLISFLSPCTLPLLPGYLSYMSGLTAEEVRTGQNTRTVLGASGLFVLGFSFIFVALGATASYIGSMLLPHRDVLMQVSGFFIIVMALVMIGLFRVPLLYREKRFHFARNFGIWSAFPMGMAFAFGWSPCIGPVLTSIFAYAAAQGTVQRGALLLFAYSLGLGTPFLVVALFAGRMFQSLGWFKRHFQAINVSGGSVLLVMGVLLVMNRWTETLGPVMRWYSGLHLPS